MNAIEQNTSSDAPLVSVCIPTFNAEKYIKKTILSVIDQSYKNIEIIILDDCSTDSTLEAVESIIDSRIRVFKNSDNVGPAGTWSKLLDFVNGDYLKILCHDDVLYERCIMSQVKILNEYSDVVLVAGNRDIIDENGDVVLTPRRFKKNGKIDGKKLLLSSLRKGTNIIGEPHAVMVRMGVVQRESIRFRDNFYLIDLDFYSEVLLHGDAFLMNATLSAFRVSREAGSYRLLMSQSASFIGFIKKLKKRGDYRVPFFDYLLGNAMSVANQIGRILFYKLL